MKDLGNQMREMKIYYMVAPVTFQNFKSSVRLNDLLRYQVLLPFFLWIVLEVVLIVKLMEWALFDERTRIPTLIKVVIPIWTLVHVPFFKKK